MVSSGKHPLPQKPRHSLWRRFSRRIEAMDFWRVLISFILAVITCLIIRGQRNANSGYASWRTIKDVPVHFIAQGDSDIAVRTGQDLRVDLDVSVVFISQGTLITADDFAIEGSLDRLAAAAAGKVASTVEYTVQNSDVVKKPAGVEIRRIRNKRLDVAFDRIVSREVPVRLNVDTSQQQPGWIYKCEPIKPVVLVRGLAPVVNSITWVESEPIVVKDTQSYTGRVELRPPGNSGSVSLDRYWEDYRVTVRKDSNEEMRRSYNNLPVFFITSFDSNLRPMLPGGRTPLVNIRLRGAAKVLDELKPEQLRVVCDLTPFTLEGGQKVKIEVSGYPDGVVVEEVSPRELTVELKFAAAVPPKELEKKAPESPEKPVTSGDGKPGSALAE